MGWCSATDIFDPVVKHILSHNNKQSDDDKVAVIKVLIEALEAEDWDCQDDSAHYDAPLVRRAFREVHPDWEELQD